MASKRVLIVDDEQRTLLFLRESLLVSGINAELVCTSSSEAALETFYRQPFDLLIADICLAGMDGVELLSELRKLQPELPAILLSGHHSPSIEARIAALGAVRYFRKPFAFESFTLAVANALQEAGQAMGDRLDVSDAAQRDGPAMRGWRMEAVRRHLTNLLQDSGAQSVCLTDADGKVAAQVGSPVVHSDQWLSLPRVEDGAFNFTYYQGRLEDVYSAAVEEGVYLVITFDRGRTSTRIGQILQYTRRTVQELAQLLSTHSGDQMAL
jgi:DNA-binding response OmpR family regulator